MKMNKDAEYILECARIDAKNLDREIEGLKYIL